MEQDFWEAIAEEEFNEDELLYANDEQRLEFAHCYAEMFGLELEVIEEE